MATISLAACTALRKALDEGVSGAEIARTLGVSEAAVSKHRYQRCRHFAEKRFNWREPGSLPPLIEIENESYIRVADLLRIIKEGTGRPMLKLNREVMVQWLLDYTDSVGHTKAERVKASRYRARLRKAMGR